MFLEERTIKEKEGPQILVSYCRNCKSTEVETIQTCKKCGSHNIANPFSHTLDDYSDGVGIKQNYKEKKVEIYKCDLCGKEFDGLKIDNYVSYIEGCFESSNYKNFQNDEYNQHWDDTDDVQNYQLPMDLCKDCKEKVKQYLNRELLNFIHPYNIKETISKYLIGEKVKRDEKI